MREVIHDVDRQPDSLRARRQRHARFTRAGAQHGDHIAEVGRGCIAPRELDPAGGSRIDAADLMIAIDRIPADACPRRQQQPQLGAHQFTGPYEKDRAGLQIEEYRKKSHGELPTPKSGLTGIIFYICL